MKKSLLICIAFHYNEDRIKYLNTILDVFKNEYLCSLDIIIDTNTHDMEYLNLIENIKVFTHLNQEHQFHLTWQHRKHVKDNIDNYDNFMYIEDDMFLPYDNYLNYLDNFKLLWPKYVPSFVRIEELEEQEFVSDIPERQVKELTMIGNKTFHSIPFPVNYHAFWIMPHKELKETMQDNFVRLSDGREFAAMYVGWELQKPTMIELENGLISKKCYSYHLPNNYALGDGPNGKIKPEYIFI